jgi:hypothetical protein
MLEDSATLKVSLIIIKSDNFDFILSVFEVRAQGEPEVSLRLVTKVNGIQIVF